MIRAIIQPKEFTGKHMLGTMVVFFGVIITVNLIMARFAVTTWSGLVVPNTYIASQQFNSKAAESRAIAALGYRVDLETSADAVSILFTDADGDAAFADSLVAQLRRPVGEDQDRDMIFTRYPDGSYRAPGALREGEWIATVTATRGDQTIYKRGHRFHVRSDGSLRR
ncbi:FixH family protein [Hoeflea halophila]|nr:FixH family protein [Hoeflea halophila]